MSEAILTQLLKINLGYEVLIEQFIKNLSEYAGCHVRIPLPIYKGQSNEAWADEKKEIIRRTKEMLDLMGIEYEEGTTDYTLMIKEPLP